MQSRNADKFNGTFSTITVNKHVSYWIFVLSEINWEDLKKNFSKNIFYITSFGKHEFDKNDVIFIFQKHTINLKLHGFVAICQIKDNLLDNDLEIVIFKDSNMAKYISSISALELFNTPLKIYQIESTLKSECGAGEFTTTSTFYSKYTKDKSVFIKLPFCLGYSLLKNLIALSDDEIDTNSKNSKSSKSSKLSRNEKKDDDFTETPYSSSESEFDDEPYYSSDESDTCESPNDDVRVVIGHIPILMIPCAGFEWNSDEFMTIKNFKKHFLECKKCDKIDNNNCSSYNFIQKSLLHCSDLMEVQNIDAYLEYYHEGKICKFELIGKDREYDHAYIFRILSKHHIYHNCVLIMW